MTTTANVPVSELRPMLAMKIGQMADDEVLTLHRVMQRIELQNLWREIKEQGARDRAAGKFDRLTETIAEVRAELAGSR